MKSTRARTNKTIAQEQVMRRQVRLRPLDDDGARFVDETISSLIAALQSGVASGEQQKLASKLLRDAFDRKQGRPAFVLKPAAGYSLNIEVLAIGWMIESGSRNFSAAIKWGVEQFVKGLSDVGEGCPTTQTVATYYKREKHNNRYKDIEFYEEVLREANIRSMTPEDVLKLKSNSNEYDELAFLFKYRHGRHCFKRNAPARKAATGKFATPPAPGA